MAGGKFSLNLSNSSTKLEFNKYKLKNNIFSSNLNDVMTSYDEINYNVVSKEIINQKDLNNRNESLIKDHADLNGDGKITIDDENLLKQHILGTTGPFKQNGDVNNDGLVNIKDASEIQNYINNSANNASELNNQTLSFDQSYTDGKAKTEYFQVYTEEPDPAIAINYWSDRLSSSDFVYPKDSKTGKSLGAWPKNYKDYPIQLTNYKIYDDNFIWPVTPSEGKYIFVYNHNGIDIMADFGTPIYSPVDGLIEFSSWGDTPNKGCDETAYTITIRLNEPIALNGKNTDSIDSIFLGHLSGIRYRVDPGTQSIQIKKGELLGFVGNAQGDPKVEGWAPHLHASYFNNVKGYDTAFLDTQEIEKLYNVENGKNIKSGN